MSDEVLTQKQVCEWLKISRSTLARLRSRGLPALRVGSSLRFSRANVSDWLHEINNTDTNTTN